MTNIFLKGDDENMEHKDIEQAKICARDVAKILAYIKQQGYALTDYEKGKIDGILTKSKKSYPNQITT